MQPRLLAYSKPFKLLIDASGTGPDAVLYHKQDGKNRVVAHASRSQKAVRRIFRPRDWISRPWAGRNRDIHDYSYGVSFVVIMDK